MDLNFIRSKFPALASDYIFMDNAGGSQTLEGVISRIGDYLRTSNVQLGATYEVSALAGERLSKATNDIAKLINANSPREIVVGPSSTMLLRILSICLSRQWKPGDEVIVTNSDHEANVSCWMDLQEKGIVVKIWKLDPDSLEFDLNQLKSLLTDKTRLVAMTHTSNVLGTINPISEVAKVAHSSGALLCVDGVAYAPHRLVDVQKFDVDFYVFSTYKVYGPHLAVMFGKYDLLREMDGINHYFVTKEEVPYKFQPGNFNFELTYSLGGITEYLEEIYNHHNPNSKGEPEINKYQKSFELFAKQEQQLSSRLLDYLNSKKEINVIGKATADMMRVPTISFIHSKLKSSDIVIKVDPFRIGIRYGDFYAKKLIHDMGLEEKDGVVRVSMVHYNTLEEVDKLIKVFDQIL